MVGGGAAIGRYLREQDYQGLFLEELGWDRYTAGPMALRVGERTWALRGVAQKRGLAVLVAPPGPDGKVADAATRRRIEKEVAKLIHEHLIVFEGKNGGEQVWQWARRRPDGPTAYREQRYLPGRQELALTEKLAVLRFSLDEEERATITVASGRVRAAFDVERVTKKFYERFQKEHGAFLEFIAGIAARGDREWYASLMLNRLMFVYFIQKRGFLDGNSDYLRDKLAEVRARRGAGEFQSFYRFFLLRLFHDGLGNKGRDAELEGLIGDVPYLNGGLFALHQLEEANAGIDVPDEAFDAVFAFFDSYQWRLDERPLGDEREINPDVLGYIFEKYINQKQMGAYYTKEDITGYIGTSTILPYLLDRVAGDAPDAFAPDGAAWRLLRENPDRYIHDAVLQGIIEPLPPEIAAGADDVSKRGGWNRPADPDFALPTETWREHMARRARAHDLRAKLAAGEIHTVDDLITHNLNIAQFAQDVIAYSEEPRLAGGFYRAIEGLTVLDPTCGSGAFLFAALNILQPLYEACLDRMQGFVEEDDAATKAGGPGKRYLVFRQTLAKVAAHSNREYFVLKTIILKNLYGVDIMAEAVEICKLRLFLKLASQVEPAKGKKNSGLEPLPDIDFNIRAGNTLVGFATYGEVERAIGGGAQRKIDLFGEMAGIAARAQDVARESDNFRRAQRDFDLEAGLFIGDKRQLREKLGALGTELDGYLAREYGVDTKRPMEFAAWRASHKPFHWFVEFHTIMADGGFDVIVGNPPYISSAKVRKIYALRHFATEKCPDVYANVLERCANLLSKRGACGMIVPLSLSFSGDFQPLRNLLFEQFSGTWFSSYARIPSALFSAEVRVRNTIFVGHRSSGESKMTTVLHRWFTQARPHLFATLSYASFSPIPYNGLIPKLNTPHLAAAFDRCFAATHRRISTSFAARESKHVLYFKQSAYNWLTFCRQQPPCYDAAGKKIPHTMFGLVFFRDTQECDLAMLLLNGKINFALWCIGGDDFHLTRGMFANFPIHLPEIVGQSRERLLVLAGELDTCMKQNVSFKLNAGKRVGNYNLAKCRAVTDKSDAIFAEHLGLTEAWSDIELLYAQVVKTDFSAGDDAGGEDEG
jgi:hypothetical protein